MEQLEGNVGGAGSNEDGVAARMFAFSYLTIVNSSNPHDDNRVDQLFSSLLIERHILLAWHTVCHC